MKIRHARLCLCFLPALALAASAAGGGTLRVDGEVYAQRAAQLVIHMLNENAENSYTPLSLKPELVIRESVRKVN